jgi:uncharacterized cupin superfamily protein
MANVFEPDWDAERDAPPFRWRRAKLGQQAGGRELGASLFDVPPGAATFPLHAHYSNEEMVIVLSGRPTLTVADGGSRQLEAGEVVACPAGRAGAHRLDNRTDEPVRILIVSTMKAPEINEMLEDNSFWVRDYPPGRTPEDPDLDVSGLRP